MQGRPPAVVPQQHLGVEADEHADAAEGGPRVKDQGRAPLHLELDAVHAPLAVLPRAPPVRAQHHGGGVEPAEAPHAATAAAAAAAAAAATAAAAAAVRSGGLHHSPADEKYPLGAGKVRVGPQLGRGLIAHCVPVTRSKNNV